MNQNHVFGGKLFHACTILCRKVSTSITGALWLLNRFVDS